MPGPWGLVANRLVRYASYDLVLEPRQLRQSSPSRATRRSPLSDLQLPIQIGRPGSWIGCGSSGAAVGG